MKISKVSRVNRAKKIITISFTSLLIVSLLFIIALPSFSILKDQIRENIILRTYIKSYGIGGIDRQFNLFSLFRDLSSNLKYLIIDKEPIGNIVIDLKFQEFEKLKKDRINALNKGIINSEDISWVKANISSENKKVKAKIRLKGDFLDHLATDKWSLRVNLKDDNLFGMQKFSIQGAYTRDFHTEPLIHYVMSQKGILAPRNFYSKLTINGNHVNTIYVEEHFTEAMTESGNKPFGPLLKYDELTGNHAFFEEKLFWANEKNLQLSMTNFENTFKKRFINFDNINSDLWSKYLAIGFVFQCFHGNLNSNLRYYFHPINKKYEPVSFDNGCAQKLNSRPMGFLPIEEDIVYKMLLDSSFRNKVIKEIEWWRESLEAKELLTKLSDKEFILRKSLISDSPFISEYKIKTDHLEEVGKWLNGLQYKEPQRGDDERIVLSEEQNQRVISYIYNKNGNYSLRFNDFNTSRFNLEEVSIELSNIKSYINLNLLNKEINLNDFLGTDNLSNTKLNITYSDKLTKRKHDSSPKFSYINDGRDIFPSSEINIIEKYFVINKETNKIMLDKNKKLISDDNLILPKGYQLILKEGSSLFFSKNKGLIVKGSVAIQGTEKNPVLISGVNNEQNSWSGVLILAYGNEVNIQNLNMTGGSGIFNGSKYRGSFTINNSKASIIDSSFSKNQSEDALNLVQVTGVLENIEIYDTPSDGLDIDYGDILIRQIKLENIGNTTGADAIDMSKSNVRISNSIIRNVTDKGISVGEDSICEIKEMEISNALVGLTSKDSSKLTVDSVKMNDIKLSSAMAYRKKSHHDGGFLKINEIETSMKNYISQKGSYMEIANEVIENKKINVEELYSELMLSLK